MCFSLNFFYEGNFSGAHLFISLFCMREIVAFIKTGTVSSADKGCFIGSLLFVCLLVNYGILKFVVFSLKTFETWSSTLTPNLMHEAYSILMMKLNLNHAILTFYPFCLESTSSKRNCLSINLGFCTFLLIKGLKVMFQAVLCKFS